MRLPALKSSIMAPSSRCPQRYMALSCGSEKLSSHRSSHTAITHLYKRCLSPNGNALSSSHGAELSDTKNQLSLLARSSLYSSPVRVFFATIEMGDEYTIQVIEEMLPEHDIAE